MRLAALTRSSILYPITDLLTRLGAPVERLLTESGLPAAILADAEGLIPTVGVVRFLNHAARSQQVDDLGIRAGLEARFETLGVFGRSVSRATTLGEALHAETTLHRAFSSNGRTWIELEGDRGRFCQAFTNGFDDDWQQANHYVLMLMLAVLRLGGGPRWWPERLELQTGVSPAFRDFKGFSGIPIEFGRPLSAVTFPRTLLETPLPRRTAARDAGDQPVDVWMASAPSEDFARSILQVVQTLSWDGYPDIRATATALGMSIRTLQRHLTAAGTTHESVVGRVRFTTAVALLRHTDATILDIALDLGYSDHAHFTRAFRRWAGCSPQEFRRAQRAGASPSIPDVASAAAERRGSLQS